MKLNIPSKNDIYFKFANNIGYVQHSLPSFGTMLSFLVFTLLSSLASFIFKDAIHFKYLLCIRDHKFYNL